MDEDEIEKNILDLKYQNRISRSNIILGSIVPFTLGIVSLSNFQSGLVIKLILTVYGSVILFNLGMAER